jgi:hypothetical protein
VFRRLGSKTATRRLYVFIDMSVLFFNQMKYRLSMLNLRNADDGGGLARAPERGRTVR